VESGIAQYKLGNYDKAIDQLQSAVDANGGDSVTYYQLGLAYMAANGREHALDDAEMAFRTAISMQPGWAAPQQLLAETLIRRGYFSGAIEPAKQAVQLDPNQVESWLTLARAYRGAGQEAEARKAEAEAARHSHP
jgi:Flp pilus assembly protein TadD